MNKKMDWKPSTWILACICVMLLIAVLLIASFIQLGGIILSPLETATISLIQAGTAFVSPLFIMSALCVPFGLLFDIVWGNRQGEIFHAFWLPTTVMFFHALIISRVDSEWFFQIDIAVGPGIGTVIGCCLHAVIMAYRDKQQVADERVPSKNALFVQNIGYFAVLAIMVVLVLGSTILQLLSSNGFVRSNTCSYPMDTSVLCDAVDLPEQAPVYRMEEIDTTALAKQISDVFQCDNTVILRWIDMSWSSQRESIIYIDTRFHMVDWDYLRGSEIEPLDLTMSDVECEKFVKQRLSVFLQKNEVFETVSLSRITDTKFAYIEMDLRIQNTEGTSKVRYKNNGISIRIDGNGFKSVHCSVKRMKQAENVKTLPVTQVIRYGKLPIVDEIDNRGSEYVITNVEEEYCYYQGHDCLLPAYKISGCYRDMYGNNREWKATIDAVDRGILPYIIPISVILIILIAIILLLWSKRRPCDVKSSEVLHVAEVDSKK